MPQEPGERWPTTRSLTYLATIFALRVTQNSSAELYYRDDYALAAAAREVQAGRLSRRRGQGHDAGRDRRLTLGQDPRRQKNRNNAPMR
jgi:hypothetical protein